MRLVDQHIHSNLGGHKGTAIQGTKRGAGAFCFQGSIIAIGIVGIAKPPLPCWSVPGQIQSSSSRFLVKTFEVSSFWVNYLAFSSLS